MSWPLLGIRSAKHHFCPETDSSLLQAAEANVLPTSCSQVTQGSPLGTPSDALHASLSPLLLSPLNSYQTLTIYLPFSGNLHLLGQPGVLFGTREFLARDSMYSCCGAEGAPCSHSPGRKRFASQPQHIM